VTEISRALAVTRDYLRLKGYQVSLGEELRFDLLGPEHTELILKWRNDKEIVGAFATTDGLSREAHKQFLATYEVQDRIDLVLVDESTNTPIGMFYLTGVSSTNPQIGKFIGEKHYRGKGLAKLATQALIRFAFDHLQLVELYAHTRKDNQNNIRLNQALGFHSESVEARSAGTFVIMKLQRS
ncbi:uncharacterized protein METZ01_LOCUS98931, partial [marine metagenome]|tara:strand:- start:1624 stop:2172 length:549 start_codon:yes stop_codon:yes gene_type:complete